MSRANLTIWCNMSYPPPMMEMLRQGTAGMGLILAARPLASNLEAPEADGTLDEADVVFGQLPPESAMKAHKLKWVHLSTAGYERYDRPEIRRALRQRGIALTTSSGVYDEPCAEHVLGMMLSLARGLPAADANQRDARGWPMRPLRAGSRLLLGQSALLLGLGAIGRRLAELLGPFRMDLVAVRRAVSDDDPVKTYPTQRVDELLGEADHVIDLLPGGEETNLFMNAARFRRMKRGAVFYNIGRGATVDQEALVRVLRDGHIAAAYLDVTEPEPLPPDHALWSAPNCHITPHTAGGHNDEFERIVRHFLANLGRFETGRELLNRVA